MASTAPTQKGFLLSATNLGIYLKINIPIFSFFGINLCTNWVITNFGSNFLEISHDFADFWGKLVNSQVNTQKGVLYEYLNEWLTCTSAAASITIRFEDFYVVLAEINKKPSCR